MGFRLSVRAIDSDEWFGDDHRLYGYWPYDEVRNSFDFLYPFILAQWEEYNVFESDEFENPAKEAYDLLCACNWTDDLELDDESFKIWIKKYLNDLKTTKHTVPCMHAVYGYLTNLSNVPGHKILAWG